MFSFLIAAIAVFLDRLLGELSLPPWHLFVKIANFVEQSWHGQEESITKGNKISPVMNGLVRFKGVLALLFLVLPILALVSCLYSVGPLSVIFNILFLYLSIRAQSLKLHALDVQNSLAENNIEAAQKKVALMVTQDTANMGPQNILLACVESVLKNGNDDIVAPFFWFILLGTPGAILYRLVQTLALLWNPQNEHYRNFGWAANCLNNLLSFIPAVLTALSYILLGEMKSGWQCLLRQGKAMHSANAGPAIAAGAGSLNIQIAGDVYYAGQTKQRPPLGVGQLPQLSDISRACSLVERCMILWLVIIFTLAISHCLG